MLSPFRFRKNAGLDISWDGPEGLAAPFCFDRFWRAARILHDGVLGGQPAHDGSLSGA
jgi:hypothetical protein